MKLKSIITSFLIFLLTIIYADEVSQNRPKIGLTLSGGGARGIAHIGFLKVLDETDIQIDYITGTSMGSIIGGLYAIGYTANELENIFLSQNWDEILMDVISLQNISIEEKEDWGIYIGSFPIEEGRIGLPVGLVAGQQIYSLICQLCLSVHHIEDFAELPIPFRCIATNIEDGSAVVLKNGFLPESIRASMSIPSIFAPIEIGDKLLVDGGLTRNFPVSDAIEMGADFVIGVDLGTPLYTKKQLNSLVKIMNQAIAFKGVESTEYERSLCDILIKPDAEEYSILDFQHAQELMNLGEQAGRKMLPELLKLKGMQDNYLATPESRPLTNFEDVLIKDIHVQGLRNVSKNLVIGKLGINENEWLNTAKLQKAIDRVYGSQYFEKVSYKLVPNSKSVDLFIRVIEKSSSNLNFGFHYDNDMDASVLVNATFRNRIIMGSKLSLSAKLSENSAFHGSYFIHTGLKPGFGFGLSLKGREFMVPIYTNSQKNGIYDYSTASSSLDIQTIFSNSFTIGGGIEFKSTVLKPEVIHPDWDNSNIDYQIFSFRGFCQINTFDRIIYPRQGVKLSSEAKRLIELKTNLNEDHDPISTYLFRITAVDNFFGSVFLEETLYLGSVKGAEIPGEYYCYSGGNFEPEKNIFPFVGHEFMSLRSENIAIISSAIRAEVKKDLFLTLKGNWAKIGESIEAVTKNKKIYSGYALSIGLMTPIGPLEVTISRGNDQRETLTSVTIGYYF